jgi:hypothetical protein
MDNPTQLSPMVVAIDLVRVNVNAMQLDDLQSHAAKVLDTIGALNDYVNRPCPKSSNALHNAMLLVRKLVMHMAHVRDLITAYTAATAIAMPVQTAGSATGVVGVPQGGTHPGP